MSIASRLGRIIGLLALAAALAGCSAIKLGYNNLGEVAYWWLDGYVDFDDDQTARVREDLARLHQWHRTDELPQLGKLLQSMDQAAPGDIGAPQFCAFFGHLRERLDAIADRAEPALVTLATSLTSEQLLQVERKFQKSNAAFRKEWIRPPAAERTEKRFDQFLERSEMIYGKLDEPQRLALRGQLQQSAFDPVRTLAGRERRQRDMLQTLRKITAPSLPFGEARGWMHGLMDRLREPADAADRAYQNALIEEGCRSFAVLHNSTSSAQRAAAVRRLRAYQRDLRELAAQR
ncbi:MAG: hypothetical protein JWQ07_1330 [Ramlibacter sp.]|nr:hypothetical protein [Ramlibacter sp.]